MAKKQCIKTRIDRFTERIPESGCWVWVGFVDADGYGNMALNGRATGAHRVAWLEYRGAIPEGMSVLHRCDVRCCVNPSHLFLGTHRDNMLDMTRKGKRIGLRAGEKHPLARLTEEDVRKIFLLRSNGCRVKDIALAFKLGQHYVSDILHGRNWAHLNMGKL